MVSNINIFGFDIGDGETAISYCNADAITQPQIIEVHSKKQIISAIAELENGEYIIGDDACQVANAKNISLRFKTGFINNDKKADSYIINFAKVIKNYLQENMHSFNNEAKVVVGCPSGFDNDKKQAYASLFKTAEFNQFDLISESRAAFLNARESGEIGKASLLDNKKVLIVDCGSSTTDFTFIDNMHESMVDIRDFGINNLGAGLIEQCLLDLNINRNPKSKKIKQILLTYPSYKARLEFEARRVKEMYFSRQGRMGLFNAESAVKLYCVNPPITVNIECSDTDMHEVLNQPQESLQNKSYLDACSFAFDKAKIKINCNPDIIILTGGASRMAFIKQMLTNYFPLSIIIQSAEPEYSIARGLSYAARIDIKTKGFDNGISELINSKTLVDTVNMNIYLLYKKISDLLVEYISQNIILPYFDSWLKGTVKTLEETETNIEKEIKQISQNDEIYNMLDQIIKEWLNQVTPYIEAHTYPICNEFSIPHKMFSFNNLEAIDLNSVKIEISQAINFDMLKLITDIVSTTIFASIMGGAQTALVATGPVGLIVGAAIGLGIGAIGSDILEKQLKKADIPIKYRNLVFSKNKLKRSLKNKSAKMSNDICNDIKQQNKNENLLVNDIVKSLEQQLIKMKENALLLIH